MNLLLITAGLALLYFGAEWLVSGASRLALSLRVSQLTVGLTVVAYGTSAPEVIVGVQSSRSGHGAVALGNIVGSNVANLGLILAVAVLVRPARVDGALARRELPVLVASALAVPLVFWDGALSRLESLALLASAAVYTGWMVRTSRGGAEAAEARESAAVTAVTSAEAGAPAGGGRLRLATIALVGLVVLMLGGQLFVRGAVGLATALGVSERVIGLTVVAAGTSLPELATSVLAARRGHSDIAVGNVLGSNIFNVLLCLAASGLAGAVRAERALSFDVVAMLVLTAGTAVFMRAERVMRRGEGVALLAAYVAFVGYVVIRPES